MNLRLKRTPGLYVVGFMASGKSTIGRALAHRLGWSFFDIDDEIEAAEKAQHRRDLFDTRGEAGVPPHRSQPSSGSMSAGSSAAGPRCWRWAAALSSNRPTANCCRQRHRRLAGLSVRNGAAPRGAGFPPAAGARSGEVRGALPGRREVYALADMHIPIESDDPEVTVEAILGHPLFR